MPPRKRKDPFNAEASAQKAAAVAAPPPPPVESYDTSRLRALLQQQAAAQDALIQQVTHVPASVPAVPVALMPASVVAAGAPPITAVAAPTTAGALVGGVAPPTVAPPPPLATYRVASPFQTGSNALEVSSDSSGAPELDPADIVFDEKKDFIGCGVFGKVYKGTCRGQVVAVKVPLNQDALSDEQLAEFRAEVAILRKIYHPNVVLFLGASTQPQRIMIVTQFMSRGSLDALLKSDTPLSFDERLSIAKDVALGLSWLHNISKIVHRDLKPANLLLNHNLRCKITDFGFAQLRQLEHKRETQPRGSVFWMSPELLTGRPFNECFPERDHQLLTNRGFLGLADVLAHVRVDQRTGDVADWRGLLVASFDARSGAIVYETPHSLVVNDTVARCGVRLIRFAVGDDDDDDDGGVSVIATANHNMFVSSRACADGFAKVPARAAAKLLQRGASLHFLAAARRAEQSRPAPFECVVHDEHARDELVRQAFEAGVSVRFECVRRDGVGGCWRLFVSSPMPRVQRAEELVGDALAPYKNGRTWCFRMPRGFVVARHVQRRAACGRVLSASPPTIQGNSVDLFSYGIILWQILTRRPLYDNQYSEIVPFMEAVCVRGERPHIRDDDCSPQLASVMRQCWAADARQRCTADHVCAELDAAYVEKSVVVAPGNALQQALDTNYDDAGGAALGDGGVAAAAAVEAAAARAFWRLVCSSNPLPSFCTLDKFAEQLKLRLPRHNADELVSRFVHMYCRPSDGARALLPSLSSSTAVEPLDPPMSVERFTLLLCCLGPWLPRQVLGDSAGALPRDVTVALDVIAWALRLADCPWFHAFADKDVAERRLANRRERTFLVRMSSTHTDFPFTISLVRNAGTEQVPDLKIQHKRIQRVWDRQQPSNCQWLVAMFTGNIVAFTNFFDMIASDELHLKVPCDKDEIQMPYM